MNIIDIAILGIIILFVIIGYSKGFVLSLLTFLSYGIALICAKLFSSGLTVFIGEHTGFDTALIDFVNEKMDALTVPTYGVSIGEMTVPDNIEQLIQQEPAVQQVFAQNPILEKTLSQNAALLGGQTISQSIANLALVIISAIIIFFIVKIIFTLISSKFKSKIKSNKSLNKKDKLMGLLFGAFSGLIIIVIIIFVLYPLSLNGGSLSQYLGDSKIASYILTSNIFINLFNI